MNFPIRFFPDWTITIISISSGFFLFHNCNRMDQEHWNGTDCYCKNNDSIFRMDQDRMKKILFQPILPVDSVPTEIMETHHIFSIRFLPLLFPASELFPPVFLCPAERNPANRKAVDFSVLLFSAVGQVYFDSESIHDLKEIIKDINIVVKQNMPKPKKKRICSKCAYFEFCFS